MENTITTNLNEIKRILANNGNLAIGAQVGTVDRSSGLQRILYLVDEALGIDKPKDEPKPLPTYDSNEINFKPHRDGYAVYFMGTGVGVLFKVTKDNRKRLGGKLGQWKYSQAPHHGKEEGFRKSRMVAANALVQAHYKSK